MLNVLSAFFAVLSSVFRNHVALQVFLEALLDDGRGHVSSPEAWQPGDLLIFLDNNFHLATDFGGRNFDRNLAFDAVFLGVVRGIDCFCGTHVDPFSSRHPGLNGLPERAVHLPFILSVKTNGEQRQTRVRK